MHGCRTERRPVGPTRLARRLRPARGTGRSAALRADESPFAALRLRTDAAKRFKKVPNATAAIWKLLMVAEKTFRRLNAPELMRELYLGAVFVDGVRRMKNEEKTEAAV
jgi:hypothetical protein